jgi:hypothetical protein
LNISKDIASWGDAEEAWFKCQGAVILIVACSEWHEFLFSYSLFIIGMS